MSQIILLEQTERERESACALLRENFADHEVVAVSNFKDALDLVKPGACDLLIANVPRFSYAYTSFLSRAHANMGGSPILVVSTASNAEVSSNVWRLGVTDYLLKPFRPNWLVSAVHVLLSSSDEAQSLKLDWRRKSYLKRLGEYLQQYKFKECVQVTREYVDSLYDSLESSTEIGRALVTFAESAVSFSGGYGSLSRSNAENFLGQLRVKLERSSTRFDAYMLYEKLVSRLFDLRDREGVQDVSAIQRIVTHIDRNVRQELTLQDMAKFASMSPSYFSKYFKRETGHNFVSYVTDSKMEYACLMLLESDMSIIQIANELAYNGANYFSKTFKKRMGLTPTEYREQSGAAVAAVSNEG
ncbi:DNA-binding response regulator [Paratractidigestivibacter sp.]|uniref:DNA-binding response regulator n=1 Tax=Paratractidigestivibacter sp. TaxID=2847316 RepID=UPI002AC8E638|nr:DNA-binding response regulator [Paratractidigestivibacter sp.]